jgi:hypothetical protein
VNQFHWLMNFRKLAAPLRVARATRREETFEMCARDYLTQHLVLSISFERATFLRRRLKESVMKKSLFGSVGFVALIAANAADTADLVLSAKGRRRRVTQRQPNGALRCAGDDLDRPRRREL